MKTKLFLFLWVISSSIQAQDFNLDNKAYQTISWNTFFERLEKNPKLIYFDIRTKGEQCDTSQYKSYNQGRIKGARSTDFFDFKNSYPEYLKHKKDTIYLYCSHSRRSRLLAQKLADSAFANVVSINGGLSYLNLLSNQTVPLKSKYYQSSIKYSLISPLDFIAKMKSRTVQLVDVRPDSTYYSQGKSAWENAFGTIDKALHIPYDQVAQSINRFDTKKQIILFDNDGNWAPIAAEKLAESNIKSAVLFFGLDNLCSTVSLQKRGFLNSKFKVITASDLLEMQNQSTVIIDTRNANAYNSQDTVAAKNMGRLRHAINIPLSTLSLDKIQPYKNKAIVLYDGFMDDELFVYGQRLKEFGIHDFYLLAGGIRLLKWTAANTDLKTLETLIEP